MVFTTEREGQIAFFKNFRIDYENNPVLVDNTDGIWNGNIFEFKLNITDLNKVLFQSIKYLSKMRIKGEPVPANILIVDLNKTELYLFKSQDYFDDIHKVYIGAASIDTSGFVSKSSFIKYNYSKTEDVLEIQKLLKSNKFTKIAIDETCIVGWAERYYRENPKATKGDFIGDFSTTGVIKITGEIREPKKFKDYILPYTGGTNEKFKYLMDQLNDKMHKKDFGAFYTPIEYAKVVAKDVLSRVDAAITAGKKDYIILDRCAGTGNLEDSLSGLFDKNGDEIISHCICSTLEYYEYKVLCERIGDKVRAIIPPTENLIDYSDGCILNADAMTKEYIENSVIKAYVNNPDCAIILFENPPYRDSSSSDKETGSSGKNESYVYNEMAKILPTLPNSNGSTIRDIVNRFIWSGFEYYLRQETDSYILFAPLKCWKWLGLCEHKFIKGYIFNRKHFHTNSQCAVSCMVLAQPKATNKEIELEVGNLDETTREYITVKKIKTKQANKSLETLFDRRTFDTDVKTNVYCEGNGYETTGRHCDGTSYYNENIIAYFRTTAFPLAPMNRYITRATNYSTRGFYVRKDNYLEKLPLFVAKMFPIDNWYEKDIYATTADGGNAYTKDANFLKSCLIYTCLSRYNKCISFKGSDGREYNNELCFDTNALARKKLSTYKLTKEEQKLIDLHDKILTSAKKNKKYNSHWNYGIYQISEELNTYTDIKLSETKSKKVYDDPVLNGNLNTLKTLLKDYYIKNITPKMFKYELIK